MELDFGVSSSIDYGKSAQKRQLGSLRIKASIITCLPIMNMIYRIKQMSLTNQLYPELFHSYVQLCLTTKAYRQRRSEGKRQIAQNKMKKQNHTQHHTLREFPGQNKKNIKSSKRVNAEDESKEMVDQRHIKLKQGNFSANGLEPAISRRPPKYINQLRIQSMDFLTTNQTNPPRDLWQGSNEHHVTQPIYMKRKSKCEKQSSKYAKIESKERYKKEQQSPNRCRRISFPAFQVPECKRKTDKSTPPKKKKVTQNIQQRNRARQMWCIKQSPDKAQNNSKAMDMCCHTLHNIIVKRYSLNQKIKQGIT